MEIYKSICPYDCPDACSLLVYIENGRVIRLAGNPEHSFTRGTLCPKMAHYERTVYHDRRLTTPLQRVGRKGAGEFRPISWDEAVEKIRLRWVELIRKYGAESILPYSYAGTMGILQYNAFHGFFYAMGASELDRTICAPAKAYGWQSVMGKTFSTAPQEAQKSDFILLWGISMLATNIHFLHDLRIARDRGAKIWCIDTYATKTAQLSDRLICVRPGTDGALALGMLHIIARDALADEAFIRRYVLGWEELREKVLPKYVPDTVSRITGVAEEDILELAHAYAKSRAPFIRLGSGLSRYTNGAMTSRIIVCLPAIVGAWSKEGGGLLTSSAGSMAVDKECIVHSDFRQSGKRCINMCKIGQALLETKEPPIKSLFVYSSNPACTAPDQNRVIQGLQREDLFTVVHERFMTDTARFADIILPATTSLEHNDLYYSYGQYTLGLGKAVILPVGRAKSNWETARLLAKAMNMPQEFFKKTEDELVESLIESTVRWVLPVDRKQLREAGFIDLPLPPHYKMHFGTESGCIEIKNEKEQFVLPDYFPAHGDAAEFFLINAPDPRVLDSSFNEREELTRMGTMKLMMHPEDANRLRLSEQQRVLGWNERGGAEFTLHISSRVCPGCVVTEGLWWFEHVPGSRSVNALTASRLTDQAAGSTFYDVKINVRACDDMLKK